MRKIIYRPHIPTPDVKQRANRLKQDFSAGWRRGKRYSKINNKGFVSDVYIRSKSAIGNVKLNRNDIPVISALVGFAVPVPFASVFGFGTGLVIKKFVNIISKKA